MTTPSSSPQAAPRTVAVVGGGPRGISAVERLIANAAALEALPLRILVIDPYRAGGGRVWSPDQPGHLLMNTLCADATHFTDDTVEINGPIRPGPTLYDWAKRVDSGEITNLGSPERPLPEGLAAEVSIIEPHSHPSRQLLGCYLEWCFTTDVAAAPEGVTVETIAGTALSVRPVGDDPSDPDATWVITVARTVLPTDPGHDPEAPTETVEADAVVLTTGHSDIHAPDRVAALHEAARADGRWVGDSTNPISQHDLEALPAGEPVIVRGLGMNFFDYMSILTIGRGGRFVESPEGPDALRYEASGREPVLIAGSGRGVPYRAKGRFGGMTPSFPKRYFTSELMARLQQQAVERGGIDFRGQMLDPILRDGVLKYYEVLHREHPEAFAAPYEELVAALDRHAWGAEELEQEIARIIPDQDRRIDPHALDRPLDDVVLGSSEELVQWWLDDLTYDIAEANLGMDSALKCASVQIGAGRAPLRTLVRFGGLRGHSYRQDAEGWFRGFGGMLASGPPARRIEELIALVRAGLVIPIGARMRVEYEDGEFLASSPTVPGIVHRAQALLEAHLPAANLGRTANPVLAALVEDGHGRPFVIPDEREGDVVSGALEVTPGAYRVVDADGTPQPGLHAAGVPLESILWGTQLQPLARTNSRMLRELDAVARDMIRPGVDHPLTEVAPSDPTPTPDRDTDAEELS